MILIFYYLIWIYYISIKIYQHNYYDIPSSKKNRCRTGRAIFDAARTWMPQVDCPDFLLENIS